ncbi:guanine-1-methyltransferase-domain-containing protein [Mrakia frigida]|uniref:tRNA (guanine(9)-N(1))-methyltransferase n=1 Tax=Mrakia frigida TaxID=29902 RepID=UPI003FCC1DCA
MDKAKEGTFFNARIVIDLGFDELMAAQEIKSMGGQMAYVYNAHRHSAIPFRSLLMTHLDQRLLERLEKGFWEQAGSRRWAGTEWWDGKELDGLWKREGESEETSSSSKPVELSEEEMMEALNDGLAAPPPTNTVASPALHVSFSPALSADPDAPHPRTLVGPIPSRSAQENVVYLTADSPHEIDALEEGMTYVIGGIVDHNRYKNLCLDKAEKLGIKTARLPIGTYLSAMPTRKVLTVNQVYEILTGWVEFRDWEVVLQKVIPQRKFTVKSDRRKRVRPGEEGFVEGGESMDGSDEEMRSGEEEEEERRGKNATVLVSALPEETEEEEQERLNG